MKNCAIYIKSCETKKCKCNCSDAYFSPFILTKSDNTCDDKARRNRNHHTLLIGKYGIKPEISGEAGESDNIYKLTTYTSFAPRRVQI